MTAQTPNFGRALRTRAAFQADLETYAPGPWFGLKTYKRGDPASPDLTDDPMLGQATDNARDPVAPLVGMPKGDVQRTVPMALAELGMWLSACFGFPSTSGTTGAYVHVFKSGAAALPFLTVEDLIAPNIYRYHRGVVVDGFSIQASKENKYPDVVLDLLMRDCLPGIAALTGDDADPFTVQRPPAWNVTALWNDAAIGEASGAAFNYKNNVDRWLGLSGDEFPVSMDPMIPTIGASMKLRMKSDTYHTLAKNGGAPGKFSLLWTLPGSISTRSLQCDINLARLSANGQPVEGPGEIISDFTARGEQSTSGNNACTVTLKNDVATYTPE